MSLFLLTILCYLLGSFPTAYLVMRRVAGVDIRAAGSGNVGARNAHELTGSRRLGWMVGLVDAAKGLAAAVLWYVAGDRGALAFAGCVGGAVVGHVLPVWLGFRGGRGLATAAGAMAVTMPPAALGWAVLWLGATRISSDLVRANVITGATGLVILAFIPESWIASMALGPIEPSPLWRWVLAGLLALVTAAHLRGPRAAEGGG